jgi:hypothetical protein
MRYHVGELPYERMDPEVLEDTPAVRISVSFILGYVIDASQMVHNIPQPAFEELIAARIAKGGKVEVRKNHSFLKRNQACTLLCDLASAGC